MEVQFYVYGVPKGFDLYGGKPDDIAYFQSYYDGSKENSKLTLHRRNNGQVIYSYLRYNLIDGDGRPGAFFGISAVFNGIYCTDVISLYELFDVVYNTILQQGILLKVANNKTIFGVLALKDAESEIKRITGIIRKNLERAFANDFSEIDTSFKQNLNEDKVCNLKPEKGNKNILQVSREFPMLSVSLEYSSGTDDIANRISIEHLNELEMAVQNIIQENAFFQTNSQNISVLVSVANTLHDPHEKIKIEKDIIERYYDFNKSVRKILSKYDNVQNQIQQYLRNQKEHPGLLKLLQDSEEGKNVLTKMQETVHLISPAIKQFGGKEQSNIDESGKKIDKPSDNTVVEIGKENEGGKLKNALQSFYAKLKVIFKILVGVAVIAVVIFLLIKFKSEIFSTPNKGCKQCEEYLNKGDDLLNQNKFDLAIAEYKRAGANGINVTDKINEVNKKAIDTFKTRAKKEFATSRDKMESYNTAVKELDKAMKYSTDKNDIEKIKVDYQEKTIDYYVAVLDTVTRIDERKKYAKKILEIDPNNEFAIKIDKQKQSSTSNNRAARVIISITKDDKTLTSEDLKKIKVGERFKVSVKPDNLGGKWKFGDAITVNIPSNPEITIEAIKVGPCKLSYIVGDNEKASVEFSIIPKKAISAI